MATLMAKDTTDKKKEMKPNEHSDPKLQAIKEIIFGENIKEYDLEFKQVRALIENQSEEFHNQLEATKKELSALVENLKGDFSNKLEDLKNQTLSQFTDIKNENSGGQKMLGKMLEDIGKKLQS